MKNNKEIELNESLKIIKKRMNIKETVDNIILYHAVLKNKFSTYEELLHEIYSNGLKRNDNGENGNTIWFASSKEYADNKKPLVLSLEYNEINRDKYDLIYNGQYGFAYKDIPFEDLTVLNIPVINSNNDIINNHDAIWMFGKMIKSEDEFVEYLNSKLEDFEKYNINYKVYRKPFELFVQPKLSYNAMSLIEKVIPNFIDAQFDKYSF